MISNSRVFQRFVVLLLAAAALCAQSLQLAVIGDAGTGEEGQRAVCRQMERYAQTRRWEFILALGDNIYENGEEKYFVRKFKDVYQPLTSRGIRFHSTLGNHDRRYRDGMAQVADDAFGYIGRQDEYVLEAGPQAAGRRLARFLCINSGAWLDSLSGKRIQPSVEERKERLAGWLDASDRYHWNILFLHEPLYSYVEPPFLFFRRGHGGSVALRTALEPLIKGRIDLVLAGHDHFYQKIRPQQGIHHVVSGAGGKLRKGAKTEHPDVEKTVVQRHFLSVEITLEKIAYDAVAESGEIIDRREIVKAR